MVDRNEAAQKHRIRLNLRKLGLPETIFQHDFEESVQACIERAAELRTTVAELEESEEWRGVELPWTRQKDTPEPEQLDILEAIQMVQSGIPSWKNVGVQHFRHDLPRSMQTRNATSYLRKLKRSPRPGSRRAAFLRQAGYDIEKVMQAKKKAKEEGRELTNADISALRYK